MRTIDRVLAIAAFRGLRRAVSLLLIRKAWANTRSHHGISTLSHTTANLNQAQKAGNDRLYGIIVSCLTLITDSGTITKPTVYGEFGGFDFEGSNRGIVDNELLPLRRARWEPLYLYRELNKVWEHYYSLLLLGRWQPTCPRSNLRGWLDQPTLWASSIGLWI
jgi:hypothetical protein